MRIENNLNKIEKGFNETWDVRDAVLSEIGMTYDEYLKSEHWAKLKQKTLRRKAYKCCKKCKSTDNINLHHKHYRFLMHVHELQSIVPLCESCHSSIHYIAKVENKSIRQATLDYLR